VIIRRATASDGAQIAAVGCRAWSSAIFRSVPEEPGARERVEKAFRAFADEFHARIIVAESGGVILGWGARDTGADYISDLWVDPAWHRKGIGLALMEALLTEIVLSGYRQASIETHARNLPAIRLYERCGFRIVRRGEEWSDSLCRMVEKVSMELLLDLQIKASA
jgi:[ribosomal protein S18]-alanine N-acetyltransferase